MDTKFSGSLRNVAATIQQNPLNVLPLHASKRGGLFHSVLGCGRRFMLVSFENRQDLVSVDRLIQIVQGPISDRFDRRRDGTIPSQDHNEDVGIKCCEVLHQLQACLAGHTHVDDGPMRLDRPGLVHRLDRVMCPMGVKTPHLKCSNQSVTEAVVIVHNQHSNPFAIR